MFAYCAASSGLNLRASEDPASEILLKIPYGAKVEFPGAEDPGENFQVENLNGYMREASYEGKTGFAFSAFFSPYPVPQGKITDKYQYVRDYVAQLKSEGFEAEIEEDESSENRMKVHLPTSGIGPAFLVMKRLFSIPNAYTLPPQGTSIDYSTPEKPSKAAQEGPYDYVTHRLSFEENNGSGDGVVYYDDSEVGGRELTLTEDYDTGIWIKLRIWMH